MITVAHPGNRPSSPALPPCRRCGGKLARDYEDIACVNCGALHDRAGNLLVRRLGRPQPNANPA